MKKVIILILLFTGLSLAQNITTLTVTIDSAGTVSDSVDLGLDTDELLPSYSNGDELRLIGIITPSTLTTDSLQFQVSADNTNWDDLYEKDGTRMTYVVGASRYVSVKPIDFAGVRYLKIETTDAEGDTRTITLVLRQY